MTRARYRRPWPLLLLAGLACGLACNARPRSQRLLPAAAPFIALERDFQDFEHWEKVDLSQRPAIGSTHLAGEAHEYINQMPKPGSKTFPVGTILVKTVEAEPPQDAKADDATAREKRTDVFAMVKRGGGYNLDGSPEWEWFELRPRPDGSLGIVWRGLNPPSGEGYGGDPSGGCNSCHQMAVKNDYVHALSLQLSKI